MAEITIAWGIDDTLEAETERGKRVFASLVGSVILQAMALGIVFSLDSAITSVGMASELSVRLTAIGFAVGGMLFFAETMSRFVEEHLFYDGLRFSG
jgi:predicted tellurium resistance membrane protein TerC